MKNFTRREFLPMVGLGIVGTSCISANVSGSASATQKIKPPALKKGDTVGICAPAGAVYDANEVRSFVTKLNNLGFRTKSGDNLNGQYGYFSAPDEIRAGEFMSLIEDEEVKAIVFIRGGWGCARILDMLDFEAIRTNPKVIMGFSDITTLLNAITAKTGLITFHGPGGNSTWNEYTLSYFESIINNGEQILFQNKAGDETIRTICGGSAQGELFGGNLSVLTSLIGSGYLPDWEGKILFLEDLKEEPYRIDRMLTQLKLSGILNEVNAVVLGVFRDCIPEEPDRSFSIGEVFDQHFKDLGKPVYSGAQFGHTRNKFILPVGLRVAVNADSGTIEMLDNAVSM